MAAKKDRKVDTRELYLIVQDNDGGIVVPCSPDPGEKVRQFALNPMAAARRAPQAAEARRRPRRGGRAGAARGLFGHRQRRICAGDIGGRGDQRLALPRRLR